MKTAYRIKSELAIISKWAISCRTVKQLNNVERFQDNYAKNIKAKKQETGGIIYHLGFVDGIILAIRNLRFK